MARPRLAPDEGRSPKRILNPEGHTPSPRKRRQSPITTLPDDRLHERRPVIDTDGEDQSGKNEVDELGDMEDGADDAEVLATARQRFKMSAAAETLLRQEMVEDQRFYAGMQWPDQIKADRTNDKRPIITINRLPQFVKQITNPQRQTRPAIQVNPVGDGADSDTAEVIQGLIRHIENTSHAEVAYDEAFEDAVVMGRGWFRVLTEYVDDGTFEQEIVVKRVPNALSVYPDPAATELDYSDARFMFIVEDVPKDEYRELYGDASMASLETFQSTGDRAPDWYPEGKVRIAEYFYVEHEDREIALIEDEDGTQLTVPKDYVPEGAKVLRTRTVKTQVVKWIKMNAVEILERKTWPGRWIPVIPVLGDEVNVNGQVSYVGVVRYAREPQRTYNFWISAMTEAIALAPKAPFVGAEGQFSGHETEWKLANVKNFPYLEYKTVSLDGKPVGAPQRLSAEPPIEAMTRALAQSDNDLKAVIGLYDASLGQHGPDQSGRAILARQKQGETANVNFTDNLGRALWHAGRVYLDLLPKVYDTPRVVHLLGLDDQQSKVTVNEPFMQKGVETLYDIRVGRYNITLSIGPSYQSKRQEAVASMLDLIKADPQLIPIIGDLFVGQMDWPVAHTISERLKKMLPPQLQDNDDQQEIPPQAKQALAQKDQQIQQLQQQVQESQPDLVKADAQKHIAAIKTAADLQMNRANNETKIAVAELGAKVDRLTLFLEERARLGVQMGDAHQAGLDRAHEDLQGEKDRQHQAAMGAAGQAHDVAATQIPPVQPPEPAGSSQGA